MNLLPLSLCHLPFRRRSPFNVLNTLFLRYIRSPEHPGKYRVVQWLGRHVVPAEGVVAKVNPQLDTKLRGQLDQSIALSRAFPMPFEQMIQGSDSAPGRVALMNTINAIQYQGDSIAQVAKQFQVKITLEV